MGVGITCASRLGGASFGSCFFGFFASRLPLSLLPMATACHRLTPKASGWGMGKDCGYNAGEDDEGATWRSEYGGCWDGYFRSAA